MTTMNKPQTAMPNGVMPQPQDGRRGGTDPGPRDPVRDRENPDLLTSPVTDNGTLPNLRFSYADARNRLSVGGWSREITERELPISTSLAGVNMRLNGGPSTGVRELHWHKQAEWAIMLNGTARLTAVDENGCNFVDDVTEGDHWNFPAGIPHSIQAHEGGCEFVLIFDDGSFSENSTFLISDWFNHVPRSVLAKNFGVSEEAFVNLPPKDHYIFEVPAPGPLGQDRVSSPAGTVPQSFTFHVADLPPTPLKNGSVRIVDSKNFPIAKTVATALVEVMPGGIRELHWHPNTDEWQYYIEGEARMGVFASDGKSRTFDYRAGDVGYVPFAMGHYVENTGTTTLRFLEAFRSDHYADVSLSQWMALTPPELVKAHLNLSDEFLSALPRTKTVVR